MTSAQTIFVVEDETSIASFIAAYLKNAGYAVRTASTAQAAVTELANEAPALIVLDLNLPDTAASSIRWLVWSASMEQDNPAWQSWSRPAAGWQPARAAGCAKRSAGAMCP